MTLIRLYRTTSGIRIETEEGRFFAVDEPWDSLVRRDDLARYLSGCVARGLPIVGPPHPADLLPPVQNQEIWAAGVTYYRSRTARMEEAREAGGSDFYDRVYHADRPELFMKASAHRVVGPGGVLQLRSDSFWIVPEPELTLVVSVNGRITGYTIGNDLSCRDIEGENPLYLPQAKTFDACAAVGPAIVVHDGPPPSATAIELEILRDGRVVFADRTDLGQMKKAPQDLVDYLYRASSFPNGCLLMTGTGIVPPDDVRLQHDDEVRIRVEPVGELVNRVRKRNNEG